MTIISGDVRLIETDYVLTCFEIEIDKLNKNEFWKMIKAISKIKKTNMLIRFILSIVKACRFNPLSFLSWNFARKKLTVTINEQLFSSLNETIYISELKIESK